ncbi:MAG: DUF2851 family protein [Saprospiraceae bacterium]|nr:DUF2851 family protein [Saprospiraceae bacterium]
MMLTPIKEDFLHYLWRTKKVPLHHFETTDGRSVEVIDYGMYNVDSGPDFFNAKIRIGGTIWAGNIEMHVFSSDWNKHRHHHDKAYENVILHVVYENDKEIKPANSDFDIPTIELKGKIPGVFLNQYLYLMQSQDEIPCARLLKNVDHEKINFWKYSLVVERLFQKSNVVSIILEHTQNDWEETLYILLARYFGAKVNAEPFERVAKSLPSSILAKNKDKPQAIEALIFGQSGMLLADYKDEYFQSLKREYTFLKHKYQLQNIDAVSWKFSKLRPVNFPTIRLAQFASLIAGNSGIFSMIKETESPADIKRILKSTASAYWDTHYKFDSESKYQKKVTGSDFEDILLINAVCPILYFYGRVNDEEKYIEKAINILEHLGSENNNITDMWKSYGLHCKSSFDSQALIHLKTQYCKEFRCLQCTIGNEIINKSKIT